MSILTMHQVIEREIADAKAEGYQLGYKAGYAKGAERTSSPEGTVAKDDMLAMLDRIQLFRQSLATFDTRYNKLGEIIADFADKLEAPRPPSDDRDDWTISARKVQIGDLVRYQHEDGNGAAGWFPVRQIVYRVGGRAWFDLGQSREMTLDLDAAVAVRRNGGAP